MTAVATAQRQVVRQNIWLFMLTWPKVQEQAQIGILKSGFDGLGRVMMHRRHTHHPELGSVRELHR